MTCPAQIFREATSVTQAPTLPTLDAGFVGLEATAAFAPASPQVQELKCGVHANLGDGHGWFRARASLQRGDGRFEGGDARLQVRGGATDLREDLFAELEWVAPLNREPTAIEPWSFYLR